MRKLIKTVDHFDRCEAGVWLKSWSMPSGVPRTYHSRMSLSGQRWAGLYCRTKAGSAFQVKNPNYVGVTNSFADFQTFVEWSRSEVGYLGREQYGGKSQAWALDKDILGDGTNYNEKVCLFVPARVNTFFVTQARRRGNHPIGVTLDKGGKYRGQVGLHSAKRSVRLVDTPEEAHRMWQIKKAEWGLKLAEEFRTAHPKLYNGIIAYTQRLLDDHANYRITEFN
jgi:hypothetical protein